MRTMKVNPPAEFVGFVAGKVRARDYVVLALEVPGDATVEEIAPSDLLGWDAADQAASRAFGGARLAAARSVLLRVPALAVPQERRRGNDSSAGRGGPARLQAWLSRSQPVAPPAILPAITRP